MKSNQMALKWPNAHIHEKLSYNFVIFLAHFKHPRVIENL